MAERRFPVGALIFQCGHRCVLIGHFRASSNVSANQKLGPVPPVSRDSFGTEADVTVAGVRSRVWAVKTDISASLVLNHRVSLCHNAPPALVTE